MKSARAFVTGGSNQNLLVFERLSGTILGVAHPPISALKSVGSTSWHLFQNIKPKLFGTRPTGRKSLICDRKE